MAGVYLATHVSSSFIFLFMGEKDAIISLCLSHMAYLLFFENRMAGGKKTPKLKILVDFKTYL